MDLQTPTLAANIIHRIAYKIATISIWSFDNFFDFYVIFFFSFWSLSSVAGGKFSVSLLPLMLLPVCASV